MSEFLDRFERMVKEKTEKEFKEKHAKEIEELKEKYAKEKKEMVITIAKKMLAKGIPQSEVVECCGLSNREVAKLAKLVANGN